MRMEDKEMEIIKREDKEDERMDKDEIDLKVEGLHDLFHGFRINDTLCCIAIFLMDIISQVDKDERYRKWKWFKRNVSVLFRKNRVELFEIE